MCSTVALLGLSVLCGLVSGSALNRQQWNIMEFLETDSGVEQVDSPSMFERTINAVHPQSELSRVAREAPVDKGECCTTETKLSLNDTRIIAKCQQEINVTEAALQTTVNHDICLVDCTAKEYDLVDGEGYLEAEKTKTFVKADDNWGPILADKESLISRCVDYSNSISREKGAVMLEGRKCNIASAVVGDCIKFMAQINCPEDRKVASKYRKYLDCEVVKPT